MEEKRRIEEEQYKKAFGPSQKNFQLNNKISVRTDQLKVFTEEFQMIIGQYDISDIIKLKNWLNKMVESPLSINLSYHQMFQLFGIDI